MSCERPTAWRGHEPTTIYDTSLRPTPLKIEEPVSWGPGRLDLFVIGPYTAMHHKRGTVTLGIQRSRDMRTLVELWLALIYSINAAR